MYPNRTKNTERRASPNMDVQLALGWGGIDKPPHKDVCWQLGLCDE